MESLPRLEIREASTDDIDAIISIEDACSCSQNSVGLKAAKNDDVGRFFLAPYRTFVAHINGCFAAYGVLAKGQDASSSTPRSGKSLRLLTGRLERCLVLPRFRNFGLHRALVERRISAFCESGGLMLTASISPLNVSAVENLLFHGMSVDGGRFSIDGQSQISLSAVFASSNQLDQTRVQCELSDVEFINELCGEGMRGTCIDFVSGNWFLKFSVPRH